MLKQTEDKTIDKLNEFLKNMTMSITSYATNYSGLGITEEENQIKNLDSWLDFKWNFLKYVVEQNQNDSNYGLYKTFFDNKDNKSKILAIIIPGTAKQLDIAFGMLVWCLKISEESKINVTEIYDKLNNNQPVELKADNDFIKFCKGMYRWSQPGLNMTEMFKGSLFSQAVNSFFNEDQFEKVKCVFKNVQDIKCNDEEFQEVQKILLELQLVEDQDNSALWKFVERKGIDKEENSIVIERNRGKHTKKTDQTTNPYTASAIIGIFLPIVPSIVFVVKVVYDDERKFGLTDLLLIIVGLIPVVSAIVFGILAYNCNAIIDDDNESLKSHISEENDEESIDIKSSEINEEEKREDTGNKSESDSNSDDSSGNNKNKEEEEEI